MMGGPIAGWMWVWPVLILGGLILIGVAVARLMQGGGSSSAPSSGTSESAARRILDERYARGEIDEEEYLRRRELLP